MNKVNLSIDGKNLEVKKGTTVLEAAREAGIYIPALCHHPDLKPIGMCKLCIVDIEGWGTYPTSCTTLAEDGMSVRTKTPELQEMRRNILEFLLAEVHHPTTCLFCDRKDECTDLRECMKKMPVTVGCKYCPQDGECEIQDAIEYLELERVRYSTEYMNLPILREPFFDRNYNLCILCGRCVRTCEEVRGEGVIKYDVGFHQKHTVETKIGLSLLDSGCKFCGACVDACPTGALSARLEKWEKPEYTITTTCPFCGSGCQMEVGAKDNHIIRVRGKRGDTVNNGQLCVKGRFGVLDFAESPERLTKPLLRENGVLVPVDWDKALNLVSEKFLQYKGSSFGILGSGKFTNEDAYVLQKFAKIVVESNNLDYCSRECHGTDAVALGAAFGSGWMTNSLAEMEEAKCVFVIGINPTETLPVSTLRMKKAKRKGAKIIVVNPRKIELCDIADIWLNLKSGTDVALIQGICKVILEEGLIDEDFIKERCEGFEEFERSLNDFSLQEASRITHIEESVIREAARVYAKHKPSYILACEGVTQSTHGTDNFFALANMAMMTGNVGKLSTGINAIRGQNNGEGPADVGLFPSLLPGAKPITDPEARKKCEDAWGKKILEKPGLTLIEMLNAAHAGEMKAMYIVGHDPMVSSPDSNHTRAALQNLEFLVVQDIFLSEVAKLADVVLPAASCLEKDGTVTSCERRIQRVRKVINPIGESRPDWEITCDIARRMTDDKNFLYNNPSEIMDEIAKLSLPHGGISYSRLDNDSGIQLPCPNMEHPGTPYLHKDKFTRGKGKFHVVEYRPPAELPDKEYPFILTTGRTYWHFHTGTMTRRVHDLNYIRDRNFAEINPEDASSLKIKDGDMVEVSSRRGKVNVEAKLTERSPKGLIFMTFHFAEASANILTNSAFDPSGKTPEYKVCAVKVGKVSGG